MALSALMYAVGVARHGRDRLEPVGLGLIAACSVLAVVLLLMDDRDAGISRERWGVGVAIGTGFALLAATAYYVLGRLLGSQHRILLVVVWVLSQLLLFFYLFFAIVMTADLINCAPEDYECPI